MRLTDGTLPLLLRVDLALAVRRDKSFVSCICVTNELSAASHSGRAPTTRASLRSAGLPSTSDGK